MRGGQVWQSKLFDPLDQAALMKPDMYCSSVQMPAVHVVRSRVSTIG